MAVSDYQTGQLSALLNKNQGNKGKSKNTMLQKVFEGATEKPFAAFVSKKKASTNQSPGRMIRKSKKLKLKLQDSISEDNNSVKILESKGKSKKRKLENIEKGDAVAKPLSKKLKSETPVEEDLSVKSNIDSSSSKGKKNKKKQNSKFAQECSNSINEVLVESDEEALVQSDKESLEESDDETPEKSDDEAPEESGDETSEESDDETSEESDDEIPEESDDEAQEESDDEEPKDDSKAALSQSRPYKGFEGREDNQERLMRTLFVGNLPVAIDRSQLKFLFKTFGKIESARLRSAIPTKLTETKKISCIRQKYHKEVKSINGYVVFENVEDAIKALVLNGSVVSGHHIRVNLECSKKEHDSECSVFIGNLPFEITDDEVWTGFAECGKIVSVRLVKDNETGVGKGFGFVQFEVKDSVAEALKYNGKKMFKRYIRVKIVVDFSKPHSSNRKPYGSKGKPSIGGKFHSKGKKNVRPGFGADKAEGQISRKKMIRKLRRLKEKKEIESILK